MDYPKSVPSVGLVGGKFVDENPLTGTPGSLVPAQWGNAVTDEVLNVIIAAGLVPDELLNNQLAAAISVIIGATRPLASQLEAEAGVDNSKSMTALRTQQAISKRAAVVGSARNVRMSITAASATATLTADEIFVKASYGGSAWLIPSFNKTVNLAATGAGGMDTGAAPASGYVSVYAIYNPTSGASALMACAQATSNGSVYSGTNMPAGYTASALVSSVPTNASSQFKVSTTLDRTVIIPSAVGYTSSGGIIPSPIPVSLSAVVPTNAKFFSGIMTASSTVATSVGISVSADAVGSGYQNTNSSSVAQITAPFRCPIITAQTTYITATAGGGTPTYNINASSYEF